MTGTEGAEREAALASTFVALADTLVNEFDVHDLFDRLLRTCVDVLGATTAGLMLADPHGTLQLVAASSEEMRALELFEMRNSQGPCLDAYASGQVVTVDLREEAAARRWPAFTPEAARRSVTGVAALPMRLRGDTIGALNVFHTGGRVIDSQDIAAAQALADVATIAILQRRALASSEVLAEQLQAALNDRIVIEQAKGLLAERGQVDIETAFALLRTYCRSTRVLLTQTARELVTGVRDPDDVLAQRWPQSL
jgi:GAF domain-containing protein